MGDDGGWMKEECIEEQEMKRGTETEKKTREVAEEEEEMRTQ